MTFKNSLHNVAVFVLMMTVGGVCFGQTLREYADRYDESKGGPSAPLPTRSC